MTHRRARTLAVAAIFLAAIGLSAQAPSDLRGRVVAVADGDTITVLDAERRQHRVRLNGIDAPETGQPFSAVSKAHLSDLVFGRDVVVEWGKIDRYGRIIGKVLVDGVDANLSLIESGLAWYYRQYASDVAPEDRPRYEAAEAASREQRRGLWRDPNPQAPWVFRNPSSAQSLITAASSVAGEIRGNRNSRVYHLPGCRDYDRVAEHNRVRFDSESDAQAAGFRRAGNC